MTKFEFDQISNVISSGAIIAIVIGSIFGLALCIGSIVIVMCVIKYCNQSRHSRRQEMVPQQPYVYPHSWATQYPPNISSVTNYLATDELAPPPYTALASDDTKIPYT